MHLIAFLRICQATIGEPHQGGMKAQAFAKAAPCSAIGDGSECETKLREEHVDLDIVRTKGTSLGPTLYCKMRISLWHTAVASPSGEGYADVFDPHSSHLHPVSLDDGTSIAWPPGWSQKDAD